jgi:hypothetical protein
MFEISKRNWLYHPREIKKNEMKNYFVCATKIKLPKIPLYHLYYLCIPPYITGAICCGIQLISAVGFFHTGFFYNSGIG